MRIFWCSLKIKGRLNFYVKKTICVICLGCEMVVWAVAGQYITPLNPHDALKHHFASLKNFFTIFRMCDSYISWLQSMHCMLIAIPLFRNVCICRFICQKASTIYFTLLFYTLCHGNNKPLHYMSIICEHVHRLELWKFNTFWISVAT